MSGMPAVTEPYKFSDVTAVHAWQVHTTELNVIGGVSYPDAQA